MSLHNYISILSRALGLLFLYVAIFLYEDEEGRYQNWLEELWIKVRYGREAALSTAAAIFVFAAQTASRIFDRVFGERLISFRVVGISICFSIASFFFFVPLVVLLKLAPSPPDGSLHGLWTALGYLALGLTPSILDLKWERRLWTLCLLFVLAYNLGPIVFMVFTRMGLHSGVRFVTFLGILLGLSFACDLFFLGFTRWMIRRASGMTKVLPILGFLISVCVVATGLVVAPFRLMLKFTYDPQHVSLLGIASLVVIPLNIVDLGLCVVMFVILVLFVVNRLLWPLFERPIYAIARYGVIKRKGLLWALGLVFLAGPENTKSVFLWIVEKLSALKG